VKNGRNCGIVEAEIGGLMSNPPNNHRDVQWNAIQISSPLVSERGFLIFFEKLVKGQKEKPGVVWGRFILLIDKRKAKDSFGVLDLELLSCLFSKTKREMIRSGKRLADRVQLRSSLALQDLSPRVGASR